MDFLKLSSSKGSLLNYGLSIPRSRSPVPREILFLPPGDQSKAMVLEGLDPWLKHFEKKKWTIVSPIAKDRKLFFRGSEKQIKPLIEKLRTQGVLSSSPIHLLGVSNGGISAFRVATLFPKYFKSITVVPGWPKPIDQARLKNILHLPINLIAGNDDTNWLSKAKATHEKIKDLGGRSKLEIIPGDHFAFRRLKPRILESIILDPHK